MKTLYTKPPLNLTEQLAELKRRGLIINDEISANQVLSEISYFRFAAYLRPMEVNKETHSFKPKATFENAIALYDFDAELRILIFKAIQKIEIALRAKIIHHFSLAYGPFWFMDMSLYDSESKFLENLNAIDREIKRTKEDFIKEHFIKYKRPDFPPAWKTLELVSFGTLSKLYYNFSDNKIKKKVAREFNLPQHEVLESWMRSIASLRNHCAHHSRIWNRYYNATPQLNIRLRGNWISHSNIDSNKLYAVLGCIAYWLDSLRKGDDFKRQLCELITNYPTIDVTAMGFPTNWNNEPLWQLQ